MPPVLRRARSDDAVGIARVNGDAWRAAYRGIFPDALLEGRGREPDAAARRLRWIENPTGAVFVVEDEVGVVGFSMAGDPREPVAGFAAELFALYVHPAWQGRGFGRGLFLAAAGAMVATGRRSWFLWTLRDNPPARAFYGRLGGRVVEERTAVVEGTSVAEVAYGWDSLEEILHLRDGRPHPGV